MRELGEAPHRLQLRGPRRRVREGAGVLDQEQVVLAHPDPEPIELQGPVPDPGDERMPVLRLPNLGGGGAELIAEPGHRRAPARRSLAWRARRPPGSRAPPRRAPPAPARRASRLGAACGPARVAGPRRAPAGPRSPFPPACATAR